MIRYIKKLISSQRGAFFVMTAMLLPLIVACGGVAIDMGNFYSHYAHLQNAADASAMASANVLKQNEDNEDKAIANRARKVKTFFFRISSSFF